MPRVGTGCAAVVLSGGASVAMGWKMSLADRVETTDVAEGTTLDNVAVFTRDRLWVVLAYEGTGNGSEVACSEVSRDVETDPEVLLGPGWFALCTSEVDREVSELSGMLVVKDVVWSQWKKAVCNELALDVAATLVSEEELERPRTDKTDVRLERVVDGSTMVSEKSSERSPGSAAETWICPS